MQSLVSRLALGVLLAGAASGAAAGAAPPPPQAVAREGIEALEAQLDRAVDRVSLPHAARLLGRAESARGYRLPGYGVVLVLTPRALPGASGHVYFLGSRAPRARRVHVETSPPGAPAAVVVQAEDDESVEAIERQVLVLQHETEAVRRAAEEEMERIVQDARIRVAPPPPPAAPTVPAPQAPTPPAAPTAPAPPAAAQAPMPVAAPETPLPPGEPGPPPWRNWFEVGIPAETRTPEAVIADVRASLVEALVAPAAAAGLAGDERLTVAVDFVPGGLFVANARPGRTLVVSVRARDVAARAKGSISAEELRRRVEVNEY